MLVQLSNLWRCYLEGRSRAPNQIRNLRLLQVASTLHTGRKPACSWDQAREPEVAAVQGRRRVHTHGWAAGRRCAWRRLSPPARPICSRLRRASSSGPGLRASPTLSPLWPPQAVVSRSSSPPSLPAPASSANRRRGTRSEPRLRRRRLLPRAPGAAGGAAGRCGAAHGRGVMPEPVIGQGAVADVEGSMCHESAHAHAHCKDYAHALASTFQKK